MSNNIASKVRLDQFDASIGLTRGVSRLKEIIWYFFKMVFFLSAFPYPSKFKVFILRSFGAKIGTGLVIKPRVNIHFPWKLEIGNNVWIGEEAFLLNFEKFSIGNNVCISQGAFLCGGNHDYTISSFDYRNAPIILEDGVWIGAKTVVCPGVICKSHSILTVGSIATSTLEHYFIYQGNPAKKIKERFIKS